MTETTAPAQALSDGWHKIHNGAIWIGPPFDEFDPARDLLRLDMRGSDSGPVLRISMTSLTEADSIAEVAADEFIWSEIALPAGTFGDLFLILRAIRDAIEAGTGRTAP